MYSCRLNIAIQTWVECIFWKQMVLSVMNAVDAQVTNKALLIYIFDNSVAAGCLAP